MIMLLQAILRVASLAASSPRTFRVLSKFCNAIRFCLECPCVLSPVVKVSYASARVTIQTQA